PVAKRITSPPAPGKAPAASTHSETGSRISPKTWENDPAPIENAAPGATGATPDTADARPSAITSSVATPVAALPANGTPETRASGGPEIPAGGGPEIPASGRPSGNRDATDAPAAADGPRPSVPPTSPATGGTSATPNNKEKRSEGSCASRT